MTIQNRNAVTKDQINTQENELKELLNRILEAPLAPLKSQMIELQKELQYLESNNEATASTIHATVSTMQNDLQEQNKNMDKHFKRLKTTISDELPELLTACLATIPQEITQMLNEQILVRDELHEIKEVQSIQEKLANDIFYKSETLLLKSLVQISEINKLAEAAADTTEKSFNKINENHKYIYKNIGNIQTDGQILVQQLSKGMSELAGRLSHTNDQVKGIAPALVVHADEMGSRLVSIFTNLHDKAKEDHCDLSTTLQTMQKRIFWLSTLCGLSFIGTAGLIASRLILH